jgi:hypothetical protein
MFVSNYQRAVDRLALEIYSGDGRMTWAKAYAMARLRLRVKAAKHGCDGNKR